MIPVTETITNIFRGIFDFFSIKLIYSTIILLGGFLFGLENNQIFLALFFLIFFDFITGIFGAYKTGQVIKSRTAVRSAFKLVVYALLVSAGHLAEIITPINTYIDEAVTTFLALTELISIIENIGKIGFAVPQKLLNNLQSWRDSEIPANPLVNTTETPPKG